MPRAHFSSSGWIPNQSRSRRSRNVTRHFGTKKALLEATRSREHDPTPDEDGAASQARIVALLYRREERIGVGMKKRGVTQHEHMFAFKWDTLAERTGARPLR